MADEQRRDEAVMQSVEDPKVLNVSVRVRSIGWDDADAEWPCMPPGWYSPSNSPVGMRTILFGSRLAVKT